MRPFKGVTWNKSGLVHLIYFNEKDTLNAKIVSEVGLFISIAPFILSSSIFLKNISLDGLNWSLIYGTFLFINEDKKTYQV